MAFSTSLFPFFLISSFNVSFSLFIYNLFNDVAEFWFVDRCWLCIKTNIHTFLRHTLSFFYPTLPFLHPTLPLDTVSTEVTDSKLHFSTFFRATNKHYIRI